MGRGNQQRFPCYWFETTNALSYEPSTKIGVVFQTSVLDEMLTVRENLTIRARQYKDLNQIVFDLIDARGLSDAFQTVEIWDTFRPKGRVDIARAYYTSRPLFLDESPMKPVISKPEVYLGFALSIAERRGMTDNHAFILI